MGVLPIFSSCYLAEIFGARNNLLSNPKQAILSNSYALVMRKIFYTVMNESYEKKFGIRSSDMLHPFLLYRCAKSIIKFKHSLKGAYAAGYDQEIDTFWANFSNRDLLISALKERKLFSSAKSDTFLNHSLWRSFNADFLKDIKGNPRFDDSWEFRNLIDFLEDRASHEALTQIARRSSQSGPELDASALAFSLGVLVDIDDHSHSHIISQGLQIVLEACDNGHWHTVMPFHFDDKGRAIFVPSIEVANMILTIYLKQLSHKRTVPDLDLLISSTDKVQRRLCEHYNTIEMQDVPNNTTVKLQGWCTDKAPSYNRVDSWVSAHALAFFIRRLALLKLAKKNSILKKYSWVESSECGPKWIDIVDPDTGLVQVGKGIKDLIENALSDGLSQQGKAPTILLYGPPGTAKTTLVQGIANKLGWDLVTLSPSDFVSKGVDKIEEYARDIFHDLMNLDKCIILMDEMDSLFRERTIKSSNPIIEFVVPAFLPKLQRLRDYIVERQMAVFIVTNYYETIDSAIARGGRIDHHFLVLPYSNEAKLEVFTKSLAGMWVQNGALTPAARSVLEKIIDHCPPLLVYREIDQLSKLISKSWPDPSSLSDTEIQGITVTSNINPRIYKADLRKDAFREVYALLDRINNVSRNDDYYSSVTKEQAAELFRTASVNITNDKHRGEWTKLLIDWHDILSTS